MKSVNDQRLLPTVSATRYVAPLREGGSLPAIIEADNGELYVVKFSGAGQGPKVLVAELLCGALAEALGLPAPPIVLVELDRAFGRNEPDEEIKDLLTASAGLNLGLRFLPGALGFEPLMVPAVAPELASAIVWFDAYTSNVDRTARNPNLLWWQRELWMIDHGAALYMHHLPGDFRTRAHSPFAPIKDHILLPIASELEAADQRLAPLVTARMVDEIVHAIPEQWLQGQSWFAEPANIRAAYAEYLCERLAQPREFVEEAIRARASRI